MQTGSQLGSFRIKYIPQFVAPTMILTCCTTYWMAVTMGQTDPFPYTTITGTATHYPECIIFRFFLLLAAAPIWLVFINGSQWLRFLSKKYNVNTSAPDFIFWFGTIGVFLYALAIATISDGKMNDKLHGFGAVGFFVLWSFAIIIIRNLLKRLKKRNPSIISDFSMGAKTVVCGIMILVWIYNGIKEIFPDLLKDDPYVDVIEWVTTFALCLFIWTFVDDWKDQEVCLFVTKNGISFQNNYGQQPIVMNVQQDQLSNANANYQFIQLQ